jgi:hypothetical protein
LIFLGGKTIADLTFTNLFVGGSSSWQNSDIQNIDTALAAAMSDVDLNNVMMQYFGNRPISTTFMPSQILSGSKPSSFSQGNVENLVTQLHSQGGLQGFGPIAAPHTTVARERARSVSLRGATQSTPSSGLACSAAAFEKHRILKLSANFMQIALLTTTPKGTTCYQIALDPQRANRILPRVLSWLLDFPVAFLDLDVRIAP